MAKITVTFDTQEKGDVEIINKLRAALGMSLSKEDQEAAIIRAHEEEKAAAEARAREEAERAEKEAKEKEAARLAAEAKAKAEKEAKEKAAAEARAKAEAAKRAAEEAARAAQEAKEAAEVAEENLEEEALEDDAPGNEQPSKPAEPEVPQTPQKPEKPAAEAYTIEEVRALLAQKVADHRQEIKNKLTSLGAPNVTNLDPAKYIEFANFLKALD